MRLTGTAITIRTGAILAATLLLCSGQALFSSRALAQSSSGNGVSNFLGNIFSGPKNATSRSRRHPAPTARRRPGAARTAPPATP